MLTGTGRRGPAHYAQRPVVHPPPRRGPGPHCWSGPTAGDPVPPGWQAHPVSLEELALAYLREPGAAALPRPAENQGTPRRRTVTK